MWRIAVWVAAGCLVLGCAEVGTSGGGGGAGTNDTGGGAGANDTGGDATDAGGGGGDAGAGGQDSAGGTDGGAAGVEKTIEALQQELEAVVCTEQSPGFTNGTKGVLAKGVVLVSPVIFKVDKPGKLDAAYVQDKGGGLWKGIYVTGPNGGELGKLKVGDVLDIQGDLVDYYCATQISGKKITKVEGATELPVAVTLTLDKIGVNVTPKDNEATEGTLVSIENVVVSDNEPKGTDGKPHGEFYVGKDDKDKAVLVAPGFGTTFSVKGSDGLFRASFPIGTKFKSIRGVVAYSFGAYKLIPLGDSALHAQ